ncbi:putative metalloprotease CJM1_0395 family protein, partial [Ectothiorhodospira mobilis]|uniref:putative metalloprotease CJM1_0395 family protein n=1 Tax=Ectothiorhodospira mobilis TaxID=195064 RepID=UPI00237BB9B5
PPVSPVPPPQQGAGAGVAGGTGEARREGREGQGPAPAERSRAPAGPERLTRAEERMLQALRQRDREVRTHEQAHMAAGGGLVNGGATYSYQQGPDGRRYAVGGEVSIDTSRPADPEEAIRKARQIARAALAPAEPSGQDYRVAARARLMEAEARRDLQAMERGDAGNGEGGRTQDGDRGREAAGPEAAARGVRERLERLFAQVDRPAAATRFRALA